MNCPAVASVGRLEMQCAFEDHHPGPHFAEHRDSEVELRWPQAGPPCGAQLSLACAETAGHYGPHHQRGGEPAFRAVEVFWS